MLNITKNQAADRHRLVWKNVFVFLVFLAVTVFCGGEPGVFASAAPIADNGFQYVHNPLENYKVVRDVDVAPETIYGFKPNSTGTLKAFAAYDFTSAMKVSEWKAERTRYHEGVTDRLNALMLADMPLEQKARAAAAVRNEARINSCVDANGNITDRNGYDNAVARAKKYTYEYLVGRGNSDAEIIESAYDTNQGMDACLGLYDTYFSSTIRPIERSLMGVMNEQETQGYNAAGRIFLAADNDRRQEFATLYSLDVSLAKRAFSDIASNASAKNMAAVQRSNVTRHLLSARLNEAFMSKEAKIKIPVQHLNESNDDGMEVTTKKVEPATNDIWLKFGKNWGDVRGDTDYHSSTILLGWDKQVASNWRAGVFAGYGQTSFSDDSSSDRLKDTRFGLYAGFNKAKSEGMVYLDYGWMRNKLRRGVIDMTASADYHSRILELGGEYLYDLQAGQNKAWHVRPYVNAQLSRLWQNGYSEDGAGVFNQVVNSKHNDYFGMGLGVEFKRYLAGGSYAVRAGVKHAFAGAEPRLRYSYMGDQANTYDMHNVQDKTHFVLSIGGEVEVAKGWSVGGDATFQRGSHDKDWSCGITVKKTW